MIEIVNDDMPFLVDSLMGELTERGIGVRLVAHPIFAVTRDGDGKLTAPPVEARADGKAGSHNESFIHIHVERIDDEAEARGGRARARSRCWPTSGSACATGSRWWRASTR